MELSELIREYEDRMKQLLDNRGNSEEIRLCEQTVKALEELRTSRKRLVYYRDSLHHLANSSGHLTGWVCAVLDGAEGIA